MKHACISECSSVIVSTRTGRVCAECMVTSAGTYTNVLQWLIKHFVVDSHSVLCWTSMILLDATLVSPGDVSPACNTAASRVQIHLGVMG